MLRPQGSNADEWHAFLREFNPEFAAVQIAEAIEAAWSHPAWEPIASAPVGIPVIVSDHVRWTLARYIYRGTHTLQLRWPFIASGREWVWVYSCSASRVIDFTPGYWLPFQIRPPQ